MGHAWSGVETVFLDSLTALDGAGEAPRFGRRDGLEAAHRPRAVRVDARYSRCPKLVRRVSKKRHADFRCCGPDANATADGQ